MPKNYVFDIIAIPCFKVKGRGQSHGSRSMVEGQTSDAQWLVLGTYAKRNKSHYQSKVFVSHQEYHLIKLFPISSYSDSLTVAQYAKWVPHRTFHSYPAKNSKTDWQLQRHRWRPFYLFCILPRA